MGMQWVTMHNGMGNRCGYVRIPSGHPWHGHDTEQSPAVVHGGITFADADVPCDAPGDDNAWWLGFDCAHADDAPDPTLPMSATARRYLLMSPGVIRTQDYVEDQCRRLAQQAAACTNAVAQEAA